MIWAMFSIDRNYDQPDNNLVGWWYNKPSIEVISKLVDNPLTEEKLEALYNGEEVITAIFETHYRLEPLEEGPL